MAVSPGFLGGITFGGAVLGVKDVSVDHTIDTIDSTCSVTTVNAAGIQSKTRVQSQDSATINVQAQFSAGGAGDPPAVGGTDIYGNKAIVVAAGAGISGNFLIVRMRNAFSNGGDINYEMELLSNGGITRTRGS